ncbi:23S rRNA pseudouridine(1911/1915/1917) synthase RluD [Lysobacter sp. CAU 1642]|uniref:Pseudouridine synthase n=1 Tax=Pseudomarimonas salicorniae TaxID=2933270 RepID=A0ABT0GFK1_9GAMM|nr:23S rRNA pseudouridine(1911/1915/1917) synthase RluD [Lysobacter sp. CAU 1642]
MSLVQAEARVGSAQAGLRLDQAVAELFPEHSRSRLSGWIKSGELTVDGVTAKPRTPVAEGAVVRLAAEVAVATRDRSEPIALKLLFEDEHLLIVDKPAGLVVHPGAGNRDGTLVNALLHLDPRLEQLPRAGIVHRLDKDTSGALLVARTLAAHTALVALLGERGIHRQYEAVVNGNVLAGGTVDAPLDRHRSDRLKRAVTDSGKPARTHYRVRERFRAHTLVECQLETGRTHQIRVHMQHIRFPLVGDPLYGGSLRLPRQATETLDSTLRGFRRQALHAERLGFTHPITGEEVLAEAPRPADLAALILALRQDRERHAD